MDLLTKIILFSYLGVLGFLSIYGLHRYFILYLYYRHYKNRRRVQPPSLRREDLPTVTIQLPIFNEFYVAERVIESVRDLDYPKKLITVQILDDSTDGTQEITKAAGEKLSA